MSGSKRKLDVLVLLADLHRQATLEKSHYYVGKVVSLAIDEISTLRAALNIKEADEVPALCTTAPKNLIGNCDGCKHNLPTGSDFCNQCCRCPSLSDFWESQALDD